MLTLVYPNDSVSMAGVPQRAGSLASRTLNTYSLEEEQKNVCSVYMRTASGLRVSAKVDVDGILTTEEVSRRISRV